MGYLLPTEYVEYGLSPETADDLVAMASALIEAYCRRPSLLVTQYVERIRLTSGRADGRGSAIVRLRLRRSRSLRSCR